MSALSTMATSTPVKKGSHLLSPPPTIEKARGGTPIKDTEPFPRYIDPFLYPNPDDEPSALFTADTTKLFSTAITGNIYPLPPKPPTRIVVVGRLRPVWLTARVRRAEAERQKEVRMLYVQRMWETRDPWKYFPPCHESFAQFFAMVYYDDLKDRATRKFLKRNVMTSREFGEVLAWAKVKRMRRARRREKEWERAEEERKNPSVRVRVVEVEVKVEVEEE